ncbi:MAG: hypothetical protein J5767_02625 [Paludibacteraceae bacterium]|nr:hypothetical protein [Paludibacteraceae bacterium]
MALFQKGANCYSPVRMGEWQFALDDEASIRMALFSEGANCYSPLREGFLT